MEPQRAPERHEGDPLPLGNLQTPGATAPIAITELRELAIEHLRRTFSELDQGEPPSEPWASFPKDFRTFIANLVHVKPGLPTPTNIPPLLFRCVEPDPHAASFLASLLEGEPASLQRYAENPAPLEACHVATALLSGGTKSRMAAIFLLAGVCMNDSRPGSAEAHMYAHSVLTVALRFGSTMDKQAAEHCLSLLAEQSSDAWQHLLAHSTSSPSNGDARRLVVEVLLKDSCAESFSMLLGLALAPYNEPELTSRILDQLITQHLPGTPGLTNLLRKIAETEDPNQKVAYGRLLSSIDGFTGDYFGRLAPWTFERPLQLLAMRNLDPLTAREQTCPHIGHSTFLAAYSLTHGAPALLRYLDTLFTPHPDLTDAENTWLTTQLRQSIIRASFLTLGERTHAIANLYQISLAQSGHVQSITTLCDMLSANSVKQRLEFPALEVMRFMVASDELDECPQFVTRLLPATTTPTDDNHTAAFLRIAPTTPPQEQFVELSESSPETLAWLQDTSTQLRLLFTDSATVLATVPKPRFGASPIEEFVRAQTITHHNTNLLGRLGEALSEFDTTGTDPQRFARWRYDERHPITARQLRSLSPLARQTWSRDLTSLVVEEPIGTSIPIDALNGKSQFLVVLTDHPHVLFNIGKIPLVTAACTSFNNGAYYSQTVVSNVADAHIKAVLVIDAYKLLHNIAPHLPSEFGEALQAGQFTQRMLSKYFYAILPAIEARSVVKLVETRDQKPVLMIEPSFVKGSTQKMHSTLETLRFVHGVSAKLQTGLALRSYVDQSDWPLEVVVLPPSISCGGQLENHDFAPWLASHHGATAISATMIKQPPK